MVVQNTIHIYFLNKFEYHIREAFIKKNGESLDLVQTSPDPPLPLPGLDFLTGIFFIVYLALIGHEIYFEQNLYFSLPKVVSHLENLAFFPRTRAIRNGKMFYVFIMCFKAF